MQMAWKKKTDKTPENTDQLFEILLKNRGINNPETFLHPAHPADVLESDETFRGEFLEHAQKAVAMIIAAMEKKSPIIIHGDYDVDGQSATAILWKTISHDFDYKNVFPYIPNRFDEGYGLSVESLAGITKLLEEKGFSITETKPLLITVDCGIVSHDQVKQARESGYTVIVSDHHQPSETLPEADCVVWTDQATGAGIAWVLSYLLREKAGKLEPPLEKNRYLDLAALGTLCDLQPLVGMNRSIATWGLLELNERPSGGIQALTDVSGITGEIGTYEVGWQLGPRLNATGRLESAMDSLRLLCTESTGQARDIAKKLDDLNRTRQEKTQTDLTYALDQFKGIPDEKLPPLLIVASETYHEGIVGLVAGKLTQQFHRPSLAIAIDQTTGIARGSARSIEGISIVEILRTAKELFEGVGGHAMAAGFSFKVEHYETIRAKLTAEVAKTDISIFQKTLSVDCELDPKFLTKETYTNLQTLRPFGIKNPEPVFCTSGFSVFSANTFGADQKHLKLILEDASRMRYTAVAFSFGYLAQKLHAGSRVDLAYALTEHTWNGNSNLELKVKDIAVQE